MIATLFSLAAATMGVQANAAETTAAAAAASAPAATTNAKPRKYCIAETLTGSRVPRKICRTRDAWLAQGWDPLKP